MKIIDYIKSHSIAVLGLLLIVSCTPDEVEDVYIDIPDSYFETKLIEQGIDTDTVLDKKILKSDAEKITRLDLNLYKGFGDITDLKGIEGFVNLTFLSAAGQKLTHIDLSHNTKLDTLHLNGNIFTSIDLSKNKDLVLVDIQANELHTITGLSDAMNLKKVNLSFNNFESFSIQNESIEVLLISHNLLKSLNTTGSSNLKNVLLITNFLTSVDFSTNTKLETIVISGNSLMSINVDQNSELTHLYSSSNLLTNLDVSNNAKLIDLRVDRNPFLTCIKIFNNQDILTVSLSDHQSLNVACN